MREGLHSAMRLYFPDIGTFLGELILFEKFDVFKVIGAPLYRNKNIPI